MVVKEVDWLMSQVRRYRSTARLRHLPRHLKVLHSGEWPAFRKRLKDPRMDRRSEMPWMKMNLGHSRTALRTVERQSRLV